MSTDIKVAEQGKRSTGGIFPLSTQALRDLLNVERAPETRDMQNDHTGTLKDD